VLEVSRRTLGEEHPGTLSSMNNLGCSFKVLGRGTEAVHLMQQAVDGSQKILGKEHPLTVQLKANLHSLRADPINSETAGTSLAA
jgi:Tetratricopeptide repeat